MNLQALQEIIDNNVELLESSAQAHKVDESIVVGIAKYSAVNGYDNLSEAQKYHFDNCIRHLIENIQCSSYNHEFEEMPRKCPNVLDDEDLIDYYQNDGKYCDSCEAQAADDAHSKESFFRD